LVTALLREAIVSLAAAAAALDGGAALDAAVGGGCTSCESS
jgi:hypothetical protein